MNENGILDSAIKQAVQKLADKGVEGCTTKDVILAVVGSLKGEDVQDLSRQLRHRDWKLVGIVMAGMIALILAVILV